MLNYFSFNEWACTMLTLVLRLYLLRTNAIVDDISSIVIKLLTLVSLWIGTIIFSGNQYFPMPAPLPFCCIFSIPIPVTTVHSKILVGGSLIHNFEFVLGQNNCTPASSPSDCLYTFVQEVDRDSIVVQSYESVDNRNFEECHIMLWIYAFFVSCRCFFFVFTVSENTRFIPMLLFPEGDNGRIFWKLWFYKSWRSRQVSLKKTESYVL